MTAPYDDLARKMAARLEHKLDPKLPALVERVLAEEGEGDGDGGDHGNKRFFDPTVAIALADLIVTVAKAAWDVLKDVREGREKKKQAEHATAQQARIESLEARSKEQEQELAFLRGLVLSRVRIAVEAPPGVPAGDRDDIYEAAAEEVVVEEKKRLRIAL
jgi:hypothetical protein